MNSENADDVIEGANMGEQDAPGSRPAPDAAVMPAEPASNADSDTLSSKPAPDAEPSTPASAVDETADADPTTRLQPVTPARSAVPPTTEPTEEQVGSGDSAVPAAAPEDSVEIPDPAASPTGSIPDPGTDVWDGQAAAGVRMPEKRSRLPLVIGVLVVIAMVVGIGYAARGILSNNEFRAPQAEEDLQKVEPSVRELRERGIDLSLADDDGDEQPGKGLTICIDAGHGNRADSTPSSADPYTNATTPTEPGGATGAKSGKEYKVTLDVAKRLRTALESYGFKVVMVRDTNKIIMSPKQRAKVANKCKADLFIRLHCDGASASESGFYTLMPGKAGYQGKKKRYKKSQKIAKAMHKRIVKELDEGDRGTRVRTDLGGFNWCKRPCVLFEMGNMANAHDDELLASKKYRQKLANAMTHATIKAFGR